MPLLELADLGVGVAPPFEMGRPARRAAGVVVVQPDVRVVRDPRQQDLVRLFEEYDVLDVVLPHPAPGDLVAGQAVTPELEAAGVCLPLQAEAGRDVLELVA